MVSPVARAVAESLDLSPDQGQRIVKHLAQHLRSQVSSARAVNVPGLGTFYLEGGHLAFRPDDTLDEFAGTSSAHPVPIIFSHERRSRFGWLKVALIIICVGVVGAAGYRGFMHWQTGSTFTALDILMPADTGQTELMGDVAPDAADDLDAAVVADSTRGLVDDPAPSDAPAVGGSFTLVVASLVSDSAAQALTADFRAQLENTPVEIVTFDNGSRYRITVGRSDTYEGITELRRQLSGLPDDTWVLELE